MHFYHPSILYLLLLLAIPVIIHLLNFHRFVPVYFSNNKLLRSILSEKQAVNKIKKRLLLAARILFWSALIFAFAGPYVKKNDSSSKAAYVDIFIDNSFSMEWNGDDGRLFDKSIVLANDIIEAYKGQDVLFRTLYFTTGVQPDVYLPADRAREVIEEIKISPFSQPFEQLAQKIVAKHPDTLSYRDIYIISDFQKSFIRDTTVFNLLGKNKNRIHLIPLQYRQPANLSIDTVWFDKPYRQFLSQDKINIKIVNFSKESYTDLPLKIKINENLYPMTFSIGPGSSTVVQIDYQETQAGNVEMMMEIEDNPVVFDDSYYLAYLVKSNINVLLISNRKNDNTPMKAVFLSDSVFQSKTLSLSEPDFKNLTAYDCVVLDNIDQPQVFWGDLFKNLLKQGKNIILSPSEKADHMAFEEFLKQFSAITVGPMDTSNQTIHDINWQHPLLQQIFDAKPGKIFMPQTDHYLPVSGLSPRSQKIMTFLNDRPFLIEIPYENGHIYFFTSPLDKNNPFVYHALFAPIIHNIALQSSSSVINNITIGSNDALTLPDNIDTRKKIYLKVENNEIIPEILRKGNKTLAVFHYFPDQPGIYPLKSEDTTLVYCAFNYQRSESNPEAISLHELEKFCDQHDNFILFANNQNNLQNTIKELKSGLSIANYFLILALIFVMAELLILKFL